MRGWSSVGTAVGQPTTSGTIKFTDRHPSRGCRSLAGAWRPRRSTREPHARRSYRPMNSIVQPPAAEAGAKPAARRRVNHWINGRGLAGSAGAADRSTTRRPGSRHARSTSPRSRRWMRRSPPPRAAFPAWRATSPAAGPRPVPHRNLVEEHRAEIAAHSPASTARSRATPWRGRRGLENLELRPDPAPAEGASASRSARHRPSPDPPADRRGGGHHAFNFPAWLPMWMFGNASPAATRSS